MDMESKKMIEYPKKEFQEYNGFTFDFYRDSIDKCGVISEECDVCGGKMEIEDNGYESGDVSVTDIHAKCSKCDYWQKRKIKAGDTYRDGYENSAIVKRYDEKNYLAIYNIKYQDEVVVFTTVFQKEKKNEDDEDFDIDFFEKKFDELEDFYKNGIQKQPLSNDKQRNSIIQNDFFKMFIKGKVGLAKTFWIFYIGVALSVALLLDFVALPQQDLALYNLLSFFLLVYKPIVLIALFRAVSLYKGSKIWAVLTKIIIVLGWGSYILSILEFF